jgi:hypothetical protein
MIGIVKVMAVAMKCKTRRDIGRLEKALDNMRYRTGSIEEFTHIYLMGYLNCAERHIK